MAPSPNYASFLFHGSCDRLKVIEMTAWWHFTYRRKSVPIFLKGHVREVVCRATACLSVFFFFATIIQAQDRFGYDRSTQQRVRSLAALALILASDHGVTEENRGKCSELLQLASSQMVTNRESDIVQTLHVIRLAQWGVDGYLQNSAVSTGPPDRREVLQEYMQVSCIMLLWFERMRTETRLRPLIFSDDFGAFGERVFGSDYDSRLSFFRPSISKYEMPPFATWSPSFFLSEDFRSKHSIDGDGESSLSCQV